MMVGSDEHFGQLLRVLGKADMAAQKFDVPNYHFAAEATHPPAGFETGGPVAVDVETSWDDDVDEVPDPVAPSFRIASVGLATAECTIVVLHPSRWLQDVLNSSPAVYMHNALYDTMCLETAGFDFSCVNVRDTMFLAGHCGAGLERARSKRNVERYGLKPLVEKKFGVKLPSFAKTAGRVFPDKDAVVRARQAFDRICEQTSFLDANVLDPSLTKKLLAAMRKHLPAKLWRKARADEVASEVLAAYNASDAYWTLRLGLELEKECRRLPAPPLELNHAQLPILRQMRRRGVGVDRDLARSYKCLLDTELRTWLSAWDERFPGINPNSPVQCAEHLTLVISPEQFRVAPRTEKGRLSIAKENFDWWEEHAGDVDMVRYISGIRQVEKLRKTYVYPVLDRDKVHCWWHIMGTDTGRLSASNPNMTNQPKEPREVPSLLNPRPMNTRDMFVAADGCYFLSVDWSQLEICITAHVSGDPVLTKIVRDGLDMHDVTAEMLGIERPIAKTINYLKLYGGGPAKAAARLGKPVEEMREYFDRYDRTYAGVTAYRQRAYEFARSRGYVSTVFGTRRYFRKPATKQEEGAVMRQASNAPIQGTAADLAKMAMVECHKSGLDLRLQVHDELVLVVPEVNVESTAKQVAHIMTTLYDFSVPLKVSASCGKRWGSMKEIEL